MRRSDYLDPHALELAEGLRTGTTSQIVLPIPTPHALQQTIMRHTAPRKVVIAGRRGGKTIMAAMLASKAFFLGQSVLIVSTTADQAKEFWAHIRSWLSPLIEAGIVYKNDSSNLLIYRTPEGKLGRIKAKTGRNPDVLRGGAADLLIMDEAAYLEERAWSEVGAPMLLDTAGKAIFISSPARRNWLYRLYQKGLDPQEANWQAWHFPTTANPHITEAALALLTADMTAETYRQEILAEFPPNQGTVFSNLDAVLTLPVQGHEPGVYQVCAPYTGRFVAGVDWGQDKDYTVIVVQDTVTGNVVHIERFNRMTHAAMRERVKRIMRLWQVQMAIVEINSIGKVQFEALQAERLPVRAFETTAQSKPQVVQALQLEFERASIHLPAHTTIKTEFEVFEGTKSHRSIHTFYSAPPDSHDDIVMATCFANFGRYNLTSYTGVW